MGDLVSNEIHLWTVKIPPLGSPESFDLQLLSPEEQSRAARFHRPEDRHRYAFCRTKLRQLLGKYLDREPSAVPIEYNHFGKPQVAGTTNPRIEFNLSHADAWAIFAFANDRPVGVDVERWLANGEWEPLRVSALTPRENEALFDLPPSRQRAVFFRMWTRKEAFLKALGTGLSIEPNQLEMGLPNQSTEILSPLCPNQSASTEWWFSEIDCGPEISANVAVPGRPGTIVLNHL